MEMDRRESYDLEGETDSDGAGAGDRADALLTSAAAELCDGLSQVGAFTEEENHRNLNLSNYLSCGTVRPPNSLIAKDSNPKEYQLTKDEFEFTKDYLNKDFRKYDHLNSLEDIYQKLDYERAKKDLEISKLSKVEVERLRKSLFNESAKSVDYYGCGGGVGDNLNPKSGYKKSERDFHLQKPDYIIKNSEFLQKSNELLSKIAKERSYKKSDNQIDNRFVSDYRKALKESSSGIGEYGNSRSPKDELSLQNFGPIRLRSGSLSRSYDDKDSDRYGKVDAEGLRLDKYHHHSQQQQHQQLHHDGDARQNEKHYSASEDEGIDARNADGISAYSKGIAHLLAGYPRGGDRSSRVVSDDTEAEKGADNPNTPFPTSPGNCSSPTMYHHPMPHSPNLNLRQTSPYPIDASNIQNANIQPNGQPRHKNQHGYQHKKKSSLRNGDKGDKNSNSTGSFNPSREHNIGLGSREHSSGTLTSRGRMSNRRHQQTNGMMSSTSSNSSISDINDDYHDVDHRRLNIENNLNVDSPPEPAPPEVPPRGPSLHLTGNSHTLRGPRSTNDRTPQGQDIFLSQEYLMSGSPRNYPTKVQKSPNNGVGPTPEYAQCDRELGISKESTLASQNRLNPGLIGNPQLGVTPATPLMSVFPLRAPPANYSPYSSSRFHIDKRCQHRCTWKCFSIALILLSLILTALLAYFGAVSSVKNGSDPAACILVEDAKAVSQESLDHLVSSQSPTEESILPSTHGNLINSMSDTQTPQSVNENVLLNQQQLQGHQELHPAFNNYWPTVTEISDFDVSYRSKINPLQFWNLEFKNKHPAFVRLNFTLPWGSNFAVYGRRNVAPSVTQYDFVEFVKGGRIDRLKREAAPVDLTDHRDLWKRDVNSVLFIRNGSAPAENPKLKKPEVLKHHEEKRSVSGKNVTKRSNVGESGNVLMVNVTLLQYFDTGVWFVSVYNDDVRPHEVNLVISEAEGVSTACPNDCSSHGSCYLGKCDCIDGYEGIDCSKSVCPVLCSNHGKYGGGICHCEEGWKGPECDIPKHDCQSPDCSGHGKCVKGSCECAVGWKGLLCNEVDCIDPTCSDHGTCVNGKCYCKAGWQGANCSALDKQVYQCLPSCSEHGTYDLETGSCKCQPFWTGSDCSKALCSLDCGPHGRCGQGKCECLDGWTGDRCDLLPCDPRCQEHGQCKNGTCVCSQGWNGKHCTIPGCKNACSRHGMCSVEDGEYHCICSAEWAGDDCSIPLEQQCNDEVDNDQDGMVDCSDSECCSHPSCSDHIMCLSSNDPVEVLLRKQPPSVTSSFYQRVKFLIEENSVQSYAHMDEYSESRVSVMRGRVVTPQGLGIVGIRVSVDKDSRFGFTLTRSGGWYDVLVNGGGAVTLQFQRSPFKPLTKMVFVPWNQIVFLSPIQMHLGELESEDSGKNHTLPPDYHTRMGIYFENSIKFLSMESCPDHTDVNPIIISSAAPEKKGPVFGKSVLLAETQIVQESILIPGSDLHLMYQSSQSAGYFSLLYMRLTGTQIPSSLTHVHIRVEIEGSIYTKMYEADPDLTHIFAWNKRNVYKQKVYGVALAKISIGYQYSTCSNVIWETQTATLNGFVVDISDIGGWSLDVHHHYNFHEGILQRGDGLTLNLKNYPRMVKVLMGTGLQRPLKCTDCNGPAKDSKLLTPVALTTGPDGSLYVGDFNLIRRITPEGNVYTVYQLSATQVSYQYYLTVSPADGKLYISNPESHQIIKVLILDPVEEPALNGDVVVGSGERCVPGDLSNCGDLGPAKQAKLAHPKGLAIASDRTMYIADGTNIRAVDSKDIIHTLVGHHGHNNHWQPIPCKSAIPASQAQLQWPTGLVLSPLDGSLYFIDDRLILKLTSDLKIRVVAGSALHCQGMNTTADVPIGSTSGEDADARNVVLGSLLALAFSPTGDLYLAQSDSRKVNTIKVVDSSGRISDFAGKSGVSEVRTEGCDCKNSSNTLTKEMCCEVQNDDSNKETLLSSNAKLYQISAIAIGPDGVVYVADQGSLHILSLEHYLPVHDENGEFKIPYPASMEMYVFNRYGQHISTRDLTSGKTKYSFLYSKNTSFGKLSTITDPSGNKILFLRDYSNIVSTIENAQDHKSDLKISAIGFLVKFSQKGKSEIDFDYDSISGLLTSRSDSTGGGGGRTAIYRYDKYGRVSTVILPTGEMIHLTLKLSADNKLEVAVTGLDDRETILTMDGVGAKRLTIQQGESSSELVSYKNGTLISRANWGVSVDSVAVARFPLLELSLPIEAEMLPMWSLQKNQIGDSFNEMEWKYSLVGDINSKTQQTVRRDIYVNKTKVLGIELDQSDGKEVVYNQEGEKLLTFNYSSVGLPVAWVPHFGHPVNVSYDRFNRLENWSWGEQKETYTYERHGLLSGMNNPHDGTTGFFYNDLNMLSKLTLPSGRAFQFSYDSEGGLRHITLPSGTKHSFSCQPSLGFIRVTYTPPGSTRSYIQHYSNEGALLQTVYPGDGARVVYRYHRSGLLSEVIHGDGKSEINYSSIASGSPSEITHTEKDLEYKWDLTHSGGKLIEERIDFGSKTGLSNAKLTYEYDDNFRVVMINGRIGGQNLPELSMGYSPKTGSIAQIGQFMVSKPQANETTVFDGTALFSRKINEYFQEVEIAVTIHRMEVFRMEFSYDLRSRISQTRTYTRNVGVNSYTNTKNFTWDPDGQLIGVEAQEPWGFKYDANGNMLALNYRGNTIPMEYNVMDRIVKFGEGQYKYDNRGLVIQNAREERFHYNAKGLLVRATKRGRFDVRYFYDHLDRLSSRKDNYGNITQFFYTNHERPNEVSQIYSPRDGKLMSLVYDDRGHLIYAQVYRHKYYIATDECGTPVMVFNQYGEGIREIMRSPYGHIVYDSNPYLYLPVDFCGGLLDQVTSLVHMQSGQVYDPLIGQWMTPNWESIFSRISTPNHLHLYRFNGNDPINVRARRSQLTDTESWLKILGYNVKSLAPQIYSHNFPNINSNLGPGSGGELSPKGLLQQEFFKNPSFKVASGFVANMDEKKLTVRELSSIQKSKVKKISILQSWHNVLNLGRPGANSEPPFGRGIIVTRTKSGMAVLNSVPSANAIYRDVFTSVFNRSFLLDLKLLIHGAQQDAFFFVKPETWKVSDDRGQLKRLGSQVNTTFHEKEQEMADIKIHNSGTVINLRYGTTPEKEKNRLLHHAKGQALRKAWHRERDLLRLGFPGSVDWSQSEIDEILKVGYSMSFEGEYVHDINLYPELAEDPFNIKFVKKDNYKNTKKRKKRSAKLRKRRKHLQVELREWEQQRLDKPRVNSGKLAEDVEFDSHALLKRISGENELSNQNYDVTDIKKILSDEKVRRKESAAVIAEREETSVSGSSLDSTKKKLTTEKRKCHVWWLSWVESC